MNITEGMDKICCKCGVLKLATSFFDVKQSKDGLSRFCKSCCQIEPKQTHKVCNKCGVLKSNASFFEVSHTKDGLTKFCKSCYRINYEKLRKESAEEIKFKVQCVRNGVDPVKIVVPNTTPRRLEIINKKNIIFDKVNNWDYNIEPDFEVIRAELGYTAKQLRGMNISLNDINNTLILEYFRNKMGDTLYNWDINNNPTSANVAKISKIKPSAVRCYFSDEIRDLAAYYKSYHEIRHKHESKMSDMRAKRKYGKKYQKRRRKSDPLFNLSANMRSILYSALKNKGYVKSSSTESIIGCTFKELKVHLEEQFEDWMTWDNKGNPKDGKFEVNKTWDVDHKIPLSEAKSKRDVLRLSHYTNLQPLCSYHNRFIKKDNYGD